MNPLSNESRALIEAARGGDSPTAADKARVRAALAATLATGAAGAASAPGLASATTTSAGGAAATTTSMGLAAKLVLVIAAVGALGGGSYGIYRWSQAPDQKAVAAPPQATAQTTAPATEVSLQLDAIPTAPGIATSVPAVGLAPERIEAIEFVPPSRRERPESATAPAPKKKAIVQAGTFADPAPPAATLAKERALIGTARAALQAGAPQEALAALRTHEDNHPNGVLAEERAALTVIAYCDAGNLSRADALRKRFIARWPQSVHATRVNAACAAP